MDGSPQPSSGSNYYGNNQCDFDVFDRFDAFNHSPWDSQQDFSGFVTDEKNATLTTSDSGVSGIIAENRRVDFSQGERESDLRGFPSWSEGYGAEPLDESRWAETSYTMSQEHLEQLGQSLDALDAQESASIHLQPQDAWAWNTPADPLCPPSLGAFQEPHSFDSSPYIQEDIEVSRNIEALQSAQQSETSFTFGNALDLSSVGASSSQEIQVTDAGLGYSETFGAGLSNDQSTSRWAGTFYKYDEEPSTLPHLLSSDVLPSSRGLQQDTLRQTVHNAEYGFAHAVQPVLPSDRNHNASQIESIDPRRPLQTLGHNRTTESALDVAGEDSRVIRGLPKRCLKGKGKEKATGNATKRSVKADSHKQPFGLGSQTSEASTSMHTPRSPLISPESQLFYKSLDPERSVTEMVYFSPFHSGLGHKGGLITPPFTPHLADPQLELAPQALQKRSRDAEDDGPPATKKYKNNVESKAGSSKTSKVECPKCGKSVARSKFKRHHEERHTSDTKVLCPNAARCMFQYKGESKFPRSRPPIYVRAFCLRRHCDKEQTGECRKMVLRLLGRSPESELASEKVSDNELTARFGILNPKMEAVLRVIKDNYPTRYLTEDNDETMGFEET